MNGQWGRIVKIEKFVIGIISTNCYLVINDDKKEAVVIDPGACPGYFADHIRSEGLTIKAVLLTHGHFDHILGLGKFLKEFDVPVYAHEAEKVLLTDGRVNGSRSYTAGYEFHNAVYVKDGDKLGLAGMEFEVLHTPGHTCGGVCYYVQKAGVLFSGDTLFQNSIGRTDMETGDTAALINSIREKLLVLPEDTVVYPGHMGETTIVHEKHNNPYI